VNTKAISDFLAGIIYWSFLIGFVVLALAFLSFSVKAFSWAAFG
jgi:hypothetical protein